MEFDSTNLHWYVEHVKDGTSLIVRSAVHQRRDDNVQQLHNNHMTTHIPEPHNARILCA